MHYALDTERGFVRDARHLDKTSARIASFFSFFLFFYGVLSKYTHIFSFTIKLQRVKTRVPQLTVWLTR